LVHSAISAPGEGGDGRAQDSFPLLLAPLSAVALAKAEAKKQKDRCSSNHRHIAAAFIEML
jgi:hypothetical protein